MGGQHITSTILIHQPVVEAPASAPPRFEPFVAELKRPAYSVVPCSPRPAPLVLIPPPIFYIRQLDLKVEEVTALERSVKLSGVDLVDGTPVLDIKPYVPEYDSPCPLASGPDNRGCSRTGWTNTSVVRVAVRVQVLGN